VCNAQTPAFSPNQIKSLSPIFYQKAAALRDVWLADSSGQLRPSSPSSPASPPPTSPTSPTGTNVDSSLAGWHRTDALSLLSRATLDVIGLAGFGYSFRSLESDTNELARAFQAVFSTARKFRAMIILQVWFPFLRRFVSTLLLILFPIPKANLTPIQRRTVKAEVEATATMRRIGTELIEEKRAEFLSERALRSSQTSKEEAEDEREFERGNEGRDLLSVLSAFPPPSSVQQKNTDYWEQLGAA
jgi:hypothetical protein